MKQEKSIFSETRARQALVRWFGHSDFRDGQLEPIRAAIEGRDAVVIMPTGSGKSLCFQLAAMLLPGTTLVISPLIALMKDQVDALQEKGIPATCLNSSIALDEMGRRLNGLVQGEYKLVYIAPERFRNQRFMECLARTRISLLTIDEAHCISQWGHDFRPDYLNIRHGMRQIPNLRIMALTATATPDVREDIIRQLGLGEAPREAPYVQVQGFSRPNLFLAVTRCGTHKEKLACVLDLIQRYHSGIVYVATRKQAERVMAMLSGYPAACGGSEVMLYHGALSDGERNRIQDQFIRAEAPVVVATNAFGMGVDRADLRFIAHWDVPGSMEAYYQEVGRAGRDGLPSYCELLFNYADKRTQEFFIDGANPSHDDAIRLLNCVRQTCAQAPQRFSVDDWRDLSGIKNPMAVQTLFGILERAGLIQRTMEHGHRTCTTSLVPNAKAECLESIFEKREEKSKRDHERLEAVIRFVDYPGCRHTYILSYFGEEVHSNVCGGCDHCGYREQPKPLDEDQWIIIQKTLSCVGRMHGNFGVRRIIQVLQGEDDPFLLERKLNELSTYGILRDLDIDALRTILDCLIRAGCISVTSDVYHLASLTRRGIRVVKRVEKDFTIPWPKKRTLRLVQTSSARPHRKNEVPAFIQNSLHGSELLKKLKEWRKETADAHKMPTFYVMSNKTLEGIVAAEPRTLDELNAVKGIGPALLAKYGEEILDIVEEVCP